MRITFISDTHTKHWQLEGQLPGGDLLIHAGDIMNSGYANYEVEEFCEWFAGQKQYDKKVFIAGNHDRAFENKPDQVKSILDQFPNLIYLEDKMLGLYSLDTDKSVKIYGSPWQPEFYNWAFNLPRLGDELRKYWSMIPNDTDILITHGPPNEARDFVSNWRQGDMNVGCELLRYQLENRLKPILHVFGHIHGAYGAALIKNTLYVNAATCTERYIPSNKPIVVELNEVDGQIIATYLNE